MACQGKLRLLCKQDNCQLCNNASLKYILQQKKILIRKTRPLFLEWTKKNPTFMGRFSILFTYRISRCIYMYES